MDGNSIRFFVGTTHGVHSEHYFLAGLLARKGLGHVGVLALRGFQIWDAEGIGGALRSAGLDFHAIPKSEQLPREGVILTTSADTRRLARHQLRGTREAVDVRVVALDTLPVRLLPLASPFHRRTRRDWESYDAYAKRLGAFLDRSRPVRRLVAAESHKAGLDSPP